jgi:RNA polymerase sigma-70 factor (ECF subfamily)
VLRLRAGSEDAATQIYLRYAERLAALARAHCSPDLRQRLEADDIVQEVFAIFFRRVKSGRYDVPAGQELWRLLLVIALNKIRAQGNYHRAARRDVRLTAGQQVLEKGGLCGADTEPTLLLELTINEALQSLPPELREVILLRIEGYEVAEIAARVGRSKRTVERVLQGFRSRLAAALEEAL